MSVVKKLEALGAKCTIREGVRKCGPVITDNGNQIIDCLWQNEVDPEKMEDELNKIVGVVENGFFTKNKPIVFVAHSDGKLKVRGL